METTVMMDPAQIAVFLESHRTRGRSAQTLEKYRRDLELLYDFLPEDKRLDAIALRRWRDEMLADGAAVRTINSRISAVNSFLRSIGYRDLQLSHLEVTKQSTPALTRVEYLRLLSAARSLDREREYLLIKVFGTLGLFVRELPDLTAAVVRSGQWGTQRIPEGLRQELLEFALRESAGDGPVFQGRNGQALNRTYVSDSIRALSVDARVAPEKANPRCLQKLCRETRAGIEREIAKLVEQSYEHLLETEPLTIGWEEASGL